MLRTGALSALLLGGAMGLAADRRAHGKDNTLKPAIYLPTQLAPDRYDRIGGTLLQAASRPYAFGRIILAFATPSTEAPQAVPPEIPARLVTMVRALPADIELGLSIGGGLHRHYEDWQPALTEPARFAQSVAAITQTLRGQLRREIQVIDMDCEADIAPSDLTALTKALHTAAPGHTITMAVPAIHDLDRFDTAALRGIVNEYNIMTYDEHGVGWSETSGRLSSRSLLESAVDAWSAKTADYATLRVGIPTYGYLYTGAYDEGLPFDRSTSKSLVYTDIPLADSTDDLITGTSAAYAPEGFVAFQSPAVIQSNVHALRQRYPHVATFFWSADGLTAEHLTAVQP